MSSKIDDRSRGRRSLPRVIDDIAATYRDSRLKLQHLGKTPLPSRRVVVDVLGKIRMILFPGYFGHQSVTNESVEEYVSSLVDEVYRRLSKEICKALVLESGPDPEKVGRTADATCLLFLKTFPRLRRLLGLDLEAAMDGDPAAQSSHEIIFSYPCMKAVTIYRVAHELTLLNVPLIPRIMTEYAHHETGIDIHPGARIGRRFFVDHGTGVVIGETTEIGENVKLYQGVTLGALSFPEGAAAARGKKRHPTIEDNVVIYSGATILGGNTVIGRDSIIGGNVWIISSVPPGSKVMVRVPKLRITAAV